MDGRPGVVPFAFSLEIYGVRRKDGGQSRRVALPSFDEVGPAELVLAGCVEDGTDIIASKTRGQCIWGGAAGG